MNPRNQAMVSPHHAPAARNASVALDDENEFAPTLAMGTSKNRLDSAETTQPEVTAPWPAGKSSPRRPRVHIRGTATSATTSIMTIKAILDLDGAARVQQRAGDSSTILSPS